MRLSGKGLLAFRNMTPTEIKETLSRFGGKANKNLGQHFLIDRTALELIIQAADAKKGDQVLEVGPGLGVLTRELIGRGAKVIAIEKDRRFADLLSGIQGLELHQADASRVDWDLIVGSHPWKFISNLPYAITSLALRKALYSAKPPEILVVLVQREVAERVVARDSKTSLLSLMVGLAASEVKIVRRVPAGSFYPPPKVESAILKIVPTSHSSRLASWGMDPEEVMKVAKKGFAHPRKLLQRNLEIEHVQWQVMSKKLGINLKARAEELKVEQWVNLIKNLKLLKGTD